MVVTRTHQAEVDVNVAFKAISTSPAAVCGQMHSAVQGKLETACWKTRTDIELKVKRAIADLRVALECNNANEDRDVAQSAAVLRNQLE